jgi:transketolase C-terminal domain/subunit
MISVRKIPFYWDMSITEFQGLNSLPVATLTRNKKLIVTFEEHNLCGGFGSAVGEFLMDHSLPTQILRIGLEDKFTSIGGNAHILRHYNKLDKTTVLRRIQEKLQF